MLSVFAHPESEPLHGEELNKLKPARRPLRPSRSPKSGEPNTWTGRMENKKKEKKKQEQCARLAC